MLLASFSYGQYIYTFNNGNADNESTVVTGLNGTVSGATLMADRFGNPNKAYNLNGTGTINLGDNPYAKGATNFSLCMWVQKPVSNSSKGFFNKGNTYLGHFSDEVLYGYNTSTIYTSPTGGTIYSNIAAGTWFHVAYVKNSTGITLYVNGSQWASIANTNNLENTTDNLIIGTAPNYTILNGGVDDIFIYDYALTSTQVLENKNLGTTPPLCTNGLYQNGLILSLDFNNNDITDKSPTGAVATTFTGSFGEDRCGNPGKAMFLNAGENLIFNTATYPGLNLGATNGTFSFSCWAHQNTNFEGYASVFEINGGTTFLRKKFGEYSIEANAGSGYVSKFYVFGSTPLRKWSHYVMTYDKTAQKMSLFIDGVSVSGTSISNSNVSYNPSNNSFIIGGGRAGINWQGWIDDVAVYDRALSAAEVAAIYGGTLPNTSIIAQPKPACSVGATLSVSAIGENLSYLWSNGSVTSTTSALTEGYYNVTVTGTYGKTFSNNVYVGTKAPIIVSQPSIGECPSKTISASATGENLRYLWSNGITTPSFVANVTGTYTLTVSSSNCTSTGSNSLTVTYLCNKFKYSFDNTNLLNEEANFLNGTVFGINSFTGDRFGNPNKAVFLGSNGYISLGDNPLLNDNKSFTISLWLTKSATSNVQFLRKDNSTFNSFGVSTDQWGIYANRPCGGVNNPSNYVDVGSVTSLYYLFRGLSADTWFHYTYVYNANGFIYTYINGVFYGQAFVGTSACSGSASRDLIVGQIKNAKVDDIYIVDYAMTQAQIIENKNLGVTTIVSQPQASCTVPATLSVSATGVGLGYLWSNGAVTSTTSSLTAGYYTVTVTSINGNIVSNSVFVGNTTITAMTPNQTICSADVANLTISVGGTDLTYLWNTGETVSSISKSVAGTYMVTVTGACGSPLMRSVSLSTILCNQFVYSFDNGNANNDAGNYYNGTFVGATLMNDRFGRPNKAFYMDGSTCSVNLGDNPILRNKPNYSFTMWVQKPTSNVTFMEKSGFVKIYHFQDYLSTTYSSPIVPFSNTIYGAVQAGQWFHIGYTTSTLTGARLYVDGTLSASVTGYVFNTKDFDLIIKNLNGGVDDIYIFDYALSSAQVLANKNITSSGVNSTSGANITATVSGIYTSASLASIVNAFSVSLTGSGFVNGASVTIGGVVLTNVSVVGNVITGTIPAGSTVINPANPTIIVQNPGASASTPRQITPIVGSVPTFIHLSSNQSTNISLSPNPSTGTFTIASTQSIGANDIKVCDLVGSSQTFTLSGNELTISKSGIYIVYILGKPIKVVVF